MSKSFIDRSQQQNSSSTQTDTPQKKIDPQAQLDWINNQKVDQGFGVFNNSSSGNEVAQMSQQEDEKLPTTLGLNGSVGLDCDNNDADVLIIKNKLIAFGFLEEGELTQSQINDAIGDFQQNVLGFSNPDKKISAKGATDRALLTYYSSIKSENDFNTIESNIDTDFTHAIKKADADFASSFANGVKINSSNTESTINLNALISLRKRLNNFGNTLTNTSLTPLKSIKNEDLTSAQKTTIKDANSATVEALKTFQNNKNIDWWSNKKSNINENIFVITGTSTKAKYNVGEVKENDATYIYLRDHKKHSFKWTKDDGTEKTKTLNNFVKSENTVNKEGLSTIGSEKPSDMSDTDFQSGTGLDESRSKALKEASSHEGNFDAINTYDKAKISLGLIQFAGGNRSIEYLFAKIKLEKPTIFKEYFGQYGVNVEFRTNSNDSIKSKTCRIIVHDPEDNKTLRGMEAEDFMSRNAIYGAIMMRAGANSEIKKMQLKIAKEKYVDVSEATKLNLKVNTIKVSDGGMNGPKDIIGAGNVSAYKLTSEYTSNNTNGFITEIDLDLNNLKLGDILKSEKELAALYGTYINTPKHSKTSFIEAIKSIIVEDGLTTEQEVKDIDPEKLLKKAKEINPSDEHKERIQDAIDEEGLSG